MFGELKSLGTILEDTLNGQVEIVDLGEMGPEDLLMCSFILSPDELRDMSPAAFMAGYVTPVLQSMAKCCNDQKSVKVAMPPRTDQEDTEYYFFSGPVPMRARERESNGNRQFILDTCFRSTDAETIE